MVTLAMSLLLVLLLLPLQVFASTKKNPAFIKPPFVEILRACWRERLNSEFINHPAELNGWGEYQDTAFIEAVELSRTVGPLVNLKSNKLAGDFFIFHGKVQLAKVVESASSVQSLKEAVENPDSANLLMSPNSFTVAHAAVLTDNWEVLQVFLDRFPKVIEQKLMFRQQTALHFAVAHESLKCVEVLLERGADIYAENYIHVTPIDLAISLGDAKILKLFLSKTDLLSRPGAGYECFRQAARLSIKWGLWPEAFEFALKGAIADLVESVTGRNLLHFTCIKYCNFLERLKPIIPFERDYSGLYPTHVAILFGNIHLLRHFSREELLKPAPFEMNLLEFAAFKGIPGAFSLILWLLPEFSIFEAASKMIEFDCVRGLDNLIYLGNHTSRVQEYLLYALTSCHAFQCASLLIKYFPYLFSTLTIIGMSIQEYAILKNDLDLVQFLQDLGLYQGFTLSNGLRIIDYAIANAKIELFHILTNKNF